MTDSMKKVRTGEPLVIPAKTYNAFIDAAEDFRARTANLGQQPQTASQPGNIVLVRNNSGSNQNRLAILGIDSVVIDPASNLDEFKKRVALSCVTPAADTHEGKFVVLAEPIPSGGIGRAYASGVCAVSINIDDEDHRYADITDGDTTQLSSSHRSSARILWKQSGTGTKWAIIRIGQTDRDLFPVKLTKDGGDDGDATTQASWTYTAKSLDESIQFDTSLTPEKQRPSTGKVINGDGQIGTGYFNEDGDFVLHDANELPDDAIHTGDNDGDMLYWSAADEQWTILGAPASDGKTYVLTCSNGALSWTELKEFSCPE